jgi:hypothetical protein
MTFQNYVHIKEYYGLSNVQDRNVKTELTTLRTEIQELNKIMERLQILDTFLLPSIQPQPLSEWTRTSSEQSLAEFYTILLEEHLQVVLEIYVEGWNPFLTLFSKTDQNRSVMFKSGDYDGRGIC